MFHGTSHNQYDYAIPLTNVSANAAAPTRSRSNRIVRSLLIAASSFVLVFTLMYTVLTWPFVPIRVGHFISNISEPEQSALAVVTQTVLDTDGDGYSDAMELANGFDPEDAEPVRLDSDEDGIKDRIERDYYGTNTQLADSDGDGYDDLTEITYGYSPIKPADYQAWVKARTSARLKIDELDVDVPVVWNSDIDKIQEDLKKGVVHYVGTTNPGDPGVMVITGHSSNDLWNMNDYGTAFALLDKIEKGDDITVDYMGARYTYRVYETEVANPDDTRNFAPQPKPLLFLLTCTPAGFNTFRLWVKAELVNAQPIDQSGPS
jgi:LPXTG-site transpeptidase (sortase) family protein